LDPKARLGFIKRVLILRIHVCMSLVLKPNSVSSNDTTGIPQQRIHQGDRWKENRRSSEDSEPATLDNRLEKNHVADGTNGAESMLRVSFPKSATVL
jgi:hypothetical protein